MKRGAPIVSASTTAQEGRVNAGRGAMPSTPTDPRIEDLVRVGKVRIAVFPPEYTKDASTGEIRGWAVDLARALAAHIGIENKLVEYPGPQPVLDDLRSGACDIAFLTMDPSWSAQVDFSPPLIQFDYTYLITPNSPIRAWRTQTSLEFASPWCAITPLLWH